MRILHRPRPALLRWQRLAAALESAAKARIAALAGAETDT